MIRTYVVVYLTLLKLNFSALVAYRSNFVNNILSSVAWTAFSLLSILLLVARTPTIYGWRREEVLLLTAGYSILIGIFHTLFSRNFERLSKLVHFGQLDSVLVKPIDSQFLVSVWNVNYTTLVRVPIGVIFLGVLLSRLGINPHNMHVLLFAFYLTVGLVCLYSLWFSVLTITIWFPRLSNIVDFMYSVSSISRFPREMFREFSAYLFYFLFPLMFIIVTPVKSLLGRVSVFDVAGLVGSAVLLFSFSRWFWKFALRYYTSTSS